MTTELEKQFFDTFGIEKTCNNKIINPANCPINKMRRCCGCDWLNYPQITDRHYLELICVLNKNTSIMDRLYKNEMNIECLKNTILKDLIRVRKLYDIKHQVQAIFKGER